MAIEKRTSKDGKPAYRVRIASVDPRTGRRQNKTVGTYRTKKEAEKAERDALVEHERGTFVDPKKTTVTELLDSWLRSKAGTVTPNSYKDYEITIRRHLTPAFGAVKVQALTPLHLQAQFTAWQEGYRTYKAGIAAWEAELRRWQASPSEERGRPPQKPSGAHAPGSRTMHRCQSVLNQALSQAVHWGIVSRNVCTMVKKPAIAKRPATVWSKDEWRAFLKLARTDTLAPLWFFLAVEGMRRGEALGLRWSDVNWERGTVHIAQSVVPDRNAKGKALIQPRAKTAAGARTVRLTPDTLAVLEVHRDRQRFQRLAAGDTWHDHDLIVATSTGTPINPNNVTRSYNRLIILTGVPRIRVHDMRHTAATLLLRDGNHAKLVSERLGHATIAITLDTYSHVLPDMQDEAATSMSRMLAEETETA